MVHPERLVVGHPFNPVYLLPLVEVCGGARLRPPRSSGPGRSMPSLGMKPLVLAKEIDGFVADRLLEALWREALWLVNDGVATVEEIDDAIRYGAGLRWSFMGTFLVYRIAGGEAGMRHFMAQFGPALQWPWTKLTDVPELTDDLLDRLVAQSDAQAAGRSIRELEALRDDCLVRVMQGLRSVGYGAGEVLDDCDRSSSSGCRRQQLPRSPVRPCASTNVRCRPTGSTTTGTPTTAVTCSCRARPSMPSCASSGWTPRTSPAGRAAYTVESHVTYLAQTRAGDRLYVELQLLDHDAEAPARVHLDASVGRRCAGGDRRAHAVARRHHH